MNKIILRYILLFAAFVFQAVNVDAQVPSIASLTPQVAFAGASITITGSGFDPNPANNTVSFGVVSGTVTSATANSIIVTVPAGASYAPVSVTVNGLKTYSRQRFTTLFSAGQLAVNSFQFTSFFIEEAPSSNTIADIDGDGRADFGNSERGSQSDNADTIAIYRNISTIGNISLAPKVNIVITNSHAYLTFYFEDIDGDTRPDLVVLNESGKFSIYRNTSVPGNISFASPVFVDLAGEHGTNAVFGDYDLDGKVDIGIVKSGNSLHILKNNSSPGNIVIDPTPLYSMPFTSTLIKTADIDGDRKIDIIGMDPTTNIISVFVNTGTGSAVSFSSINLTLPASSGTFDIADMDGDERSDIIIASAGLSIFKNTSLPGAVSFAARDDRIINISNILVNDMDGDGKPDIVGNLNPDSTTILVNTSTVGNISFSQGISYINSPYSTIYSSPHMIYDFDNDSKPDILVDLLADFSSGLFYLKNKTGEPRLTSFSPTNGTGPTNITISGYNLGSTTAITIGGTAVSSFTVINSNTLAAVVTPGSYGAVVVTTPQGIDSIAAYNTPVIKSFSPNTAGPGGFQSIVTIQGINFTGAIAVTFGGVPAARFTVVADTVITATVSDTGATGNISVSTVYGTAIRGGFYFAMATLKELCPPTASASLTAEPGFLTYRWKVNTGNGIYTTITDNSYYSGSTSVNLQLNNIPSSWYGYTYHYQMSIDGVTWSTIFGAYYLIKFVNRWNGSVSTAWENPANWSCGTVPDAGTDVIIPAGSTITLHSNTVIRSMTVGAGATVTVGAGFNLSILH